MIPQQLTDIRSYCPDSPLIKLNDPWLDKYSLQVYIKRDDLIDFRISGNKFRKLKYSLLRYSENKYAGAVSFGGQWSNHLHAFSCVCEKYQIPSVALIRGHRSANPGHTLKDIEAAGTDIHFVSRKDYRDLRIYREENKLSEHPLLKPWKDHMIIPEGGSSTDALLGVADIISEDQQTFDAIYTACGTGATLAGLCHGLAITPATQLIGIAALKTGMSLEHNVENLLKNFGKPYSANWKIDKNYHFGGFAKINNELIDFMNQLYQRSGLVTEPVYTAKCMYALYDHIQKGYFAPDKKIMMLHTGGLQGLRGFKGRGVGQLLSAAGYY